MKQLIQNLRDGKTIVKDVPIPTTRRGMALISTAASLVSSGTERMVVEFGEKSLLGKARSRPDLVHQVVDKARREGLLTTLEAAFNRLDQPMPLGYSSAGTIIEIGEDLQGFKVGDRVACAGGGYAVHAEYALVPGNLLALLPPSVDFESAAFTTLGAISLHGFRLAKPQIGERIAVIGLGLLGLLAVGIARAAGCHVMGIDLDAKRVELARQMGVSAVLRHQAEDAVTSFTQGRGVDIVLICADNPSADPVVLAGDLACDRGKVVAIGAVGLNIPRKIYYEKELSFINSRSYGPGRYDPRYEEQGVDYPFGYVRWTEGRNLQAFVELLADGQVDVQPLISHRFPIEQAPTAYELITGKKKEAFLGVILTYPEKDEELKRKNLILKTEKITKGGERTARRKTSDVRLGVLGAGNFANAVMLPAIKKIPQIELVSITSAAGLHARHAADKFGFNHVAAYEQEMLEDDDINTIAILTRHDLHAAQVLRALQAGKNVFCEKPLAVNAPQLDEIRQYLRTAEGMPLLMVGFNRRFSPLANKMKTFLADRTEPLVAYYRVNAGFIPQNHWVHDLEQGGGRIIGEGCHFIDFLTYLVGEHPILVNAHALPDAGRYREDNAVLIYTFPDGSLGTVAYLANGDKAFPKEQVEVFCGGKVAVLDDFRSLTLVENGRRHVMRTRFKQDKGHRLEWVAFSEAVQAGGAPPIPYAEILGVTQASIKTVEALRQQTATSIKPFAVD